MLTSYTVETAPEASRVFLKEAEASFGFVPNLIKILAGSPGTYEAYNTLFEIFFHKTTLSMLEAQIVLMTSSLENKCHYDVAAHSWGLELTKAPQDIIDSLRNGLKLNDPKLEALRLFTKELILNHGHVSRDCVQQFLEAGYTENNILEILVGLAAKLISNFSNSIADTELDASILKHKWNGVK
jgi:uncharacterized peroxidase-related enzyme